MHWSQIQPISSDKRSYAVLAGTLTNSLLPDILRAGLNQTENSQLYPLELPVEEFDSCIEALKQAGVYGAAVAAPHKTLAAKLGTKFFTVRHALGVANTLEFRQDGIYAQNTEVPAIQMLTQNLEPATALVLGAGSGARSVAVALMENGWKVRLWNRNGMRSRLLQTTLKAFGDIEILPHAEPVGCSLIVNATSLGAKAGQRPPVDWKPIKSGTTCLDLVYRRVPTEFLREAALHGCKTIDGRTLVVEKAALSIEWWTDQQIDRTPMLLAAGLRA